MMLRQKIGAVGDLRWLFINDIVSLFRLAAASA